MSHKLSLKIKITLSFLILSLILVIIFMFNSSQKSMKYEILETRNFSCPSMMGFTFEYPVFKGWEISSTKESKGGGGSDECFIMLNHPKKISLETNPQIIITKQPYSEKDFEIPAEAVSYPNPNHVPYIYTKEGALHEGKNYGYVGFYGEDFKFWILLDGISEKSGFPTDQFFKTVIESFSFTGQKNQDGSEGQTKAQPFEGILEEGHVYEATWPIEDEVLQNLPFHHAFNIEWENITDFPQIKNSDEFVFKVISKKTSKVFNQYRWNDFYVCKIVTVQ
jgi:hypothetical protein